jgi:hypothetical protein
MSCPYSLTLDYQLSEQARCSFKKWPAHGEKMGWGRVLRNLSPPPLTGFPVFLFALTFLAVPSIF